MTTEDMIRLDLQLPLIVEETRISKKIDKKVSIKKKKSLPPQTRKLTWWESLSRDERELYIQKNKQRRKEARKNKPIPENKIYKNGTVKVWHSRDSYSIFKDLDAYDRYLAFQP